MAYAGIIRTSNDVCLLSVCLLVNARNSTCADSNDFRSCCRLASQPLPTGKYILRQKIRGANQFQRKKGKFWTFIGMSCMDIQDPRSAQISKRIFFSSISDFSILSNATLMTYLSSLRSRRSNSRWQSILQHSPKCLLDAWLEHPHIQLSSNTATSANQLVCTV